MGLGPTVAIRLAAATAITLLVARADFVVGDARCGVMLAWTPLIIAAWIRFERPRHPRPGARVAEAAATMDRILLGA